MGILDGLGPLSAASALRDIGAPPWRTGAPDDGPDPADPAIDGATPPPVARMEAAAELVAAFARNPELGAYASAAPVAADGQAGGADTRVHGIVDLGADTAGQTAAIRQKDPDAVTHAVRDADPPDLGTILAEAETGRSVGGRPLLSFDTMDAFNVAANAARPDTVYEFDTYRWTTDDQARVIRAEGRVDLEPVGRNDAELQREIGNEGRDTDVGFHVIADRLGGPTNRLNVVPGNGKPIGDGLPNLNNGDYKRFENELARLAEAGHAVDMRVSPQYNPGNTSHRPDVFVAEYRVDGGDWIDQTFPNK